MRFVASKEAHPVHGHWIPESEYIPPHVNPSIQFIQDSMKPMFSVADGKLYDSKSEYTKSLKRLGKIELGGQPLEYFTRKQPEVDQKPAIRNLLVEAWDKHGR